MESQNKAQNKGLSQLPKKNKVPNFSTASKRAKKVVKQVNEEIKAAEVMMRVAQEDKAHVLKQFKGEITPQVKKEKATKKVKTGYLALIVIVSLFFQTGMCLKVADVSTKLTILNATTDLNNILTKITQINVLESNNEDMEAINNLLELYNSNFKEIETKIKRDLPDSNSVERKKLKSRMRNTRQALDKVIGERDFLLELYHLSSFIRSVGKLHISYSPN